MVDKQVLEVRKKFLETFIRRNIIWNKHFGNIDETFWEARDKWVDCATEKLLKVRHVYFNLLKDDLVKDFEKYIDEEMDKGNVIEKYISFGNIRETDPDKEVYSDKDNNQKQPYAPMNKISDESLIRIAHEINNVDSYKPQVEKNSKSSKGIMKTFHRKKININIYIR